MSAYFLDRSALVKAYRQEIGTQWVRQLLSAASANENHVAHICGAEVVAAVVRQQRTGNLPALEAQAAISAFKADFARCFRIVVTGGTVIKEAMRLIETHGLRGYDGVQLGSAMLIHHARKAASLPALVFVSADHKLNTTASVEGLRVEDPNLHA